MDFKQKFVGKPLQVYCCFVVLRALKKMGHRDIRPEGFDIT